MEHMSYGDFLALVAWKQKHAPLMLKLQMSYVVLKRDRESSSDKQMKEAHTKWRG